MEKGAPRPGIPRRRRRDTNRRESFVQIVQSGKTRLGILISRDSAPIRCDLNWCTGLFCRLVNRPPTEQWPEQRWSNRCNYLFRNRDAFTSIQRGTHTHTHMHTFSRVLSPTRWKYIISCASLRNYNREVLGIVQPCPTSSFARAKWPMIDLSRWSVPWRWFGAIAARGEGWLFVEGNRVWIRKRFTFLRTHRTAPRVQLSAKETACTIRKEEKVTIVGTFCFNYRTLPCEM